MIPVYFRPLAASAARLGAFARRLGRALAARGKGPAQHAIHDGYLFRATHHGLHVKVTALDTPAVWLFPHYNSYGPGTWPINSAARHLVRDVLQPGENNVFDPLAVSSANALGFAMHGSALTSSVSGSTYYHAQGQTDWRGDYALSVTYLTDGNALFPGPTTASYVVATGAGYHSKVGRFGQEVDYAYRFEGQMRYVWTEASLRTWAGNSKLRLIPYNPPWNPSRSLQVTAPRLELDPTTNTLYEQLAAVSTYTLQGAYSSDPALDKSRETEHGWLIGRFRALRDGYYVERPLEQVWSWFFSMAANVDARLAALAHPEYPGRFARHNVVDVACCEGDTHLVAVVTCTRRQIDTTDSSSTNVDTTGVQVFRFDRASGAYTWTTERLVSYVEADATATVKPHSFGLNRLAYHYPAALGGSVTVEALACVQFDCAAAIDPATIELVLYDTDAVKRTTGLGAAGWAPHWPKLRGYCSPWGHVDNLGYALAPQHAVVQALGPGLLGVVAATKGAVTTGDPIGWTLVVLDAETLAFVEARGEIAALPYRTDTVVCFSVVQQEVDGSPAVLAAWYYAGGGTRGHVLSRDGGRTWQPLFSGVNGLPIYLGNQLRPKPLATAL